MTARAWPMPRSWADEKATTVVAFLRRAIAFYGRHGIDVHQLLTDQ